MNEHANPTWSSRLTIVCANVAAVLMLGAMCAAGMPRPVEAATATARTGDGSVQRQQPSNTGYIRLAQRYLPGVGTQRRCPPGTIGRFPACRPVFKPQRRRCRHGTIGVFPNCRKIVRPRCPFGTHGKWPVCIKIERRRCPRNTVGRWPDCRKIARNPPRRKKCRRGWSGRYPDCWKKTTKRPRKCGRGETGRWPKCKAVTKKPPRKKVKPSRRKEVARPGRKAPTRGRVSPPRRTVTAPTDRRPDEIVVVLDQSQAGAVEAAIAQQYRLVRLQGQTIELLQARVQRYRIPDRRSPAEVVTAMQGDTRVSLVQPNFLYRLQAKRRRRKKKSSTSKSSMLTLQYAPKSIRLGPAHRLAVGRQTIVSVIDSGVDLKHPELKGAVVDTFNAAGARTTKPDAHGTAIAGIIGARGKMTGVAPAVRLLAARAFIRERGGSPLTTTFILLRAIDWSYSNKARIFNLSFAGPKDSAFHRIITAAHARGALLVAAAGNAGRKAPAAYPAAYPEVLAITAVDKANRLYAKANRGSYVAIAAPGVDILVPVPRGGYDIKSGTSFAAAHVSGMIALMLERNPGLTTEQVRLHLTSAAHDLGPKGRDKLFGAGRADALESVRAVIDGLVALPMKGIRAKPTISPVSSKR